LILGFYAGKSHNLIGLGIFHGDLDFFDLHEKSLDLSNYEVFPHKILKSRTFKKSSVLIAKKLAIGNPQVLGLIQLLQFRKLLRYASLQIRKSQICKFPQKNP
jgi:hypothetical protein